jgi:hypothetical protein
MSYEKALEAAGATIHQFKDFGSYQGEWFALVTYNGDTGWIQGSFGSCSHCDAFEGEFGWDEHEWCDQHSYDPQADCIGCQKAKAKYQIKLANFGKGYLDGLQQGTAILASLDKQSEWDSESHEAAAWIRGLGSAAGKPTEHKL